MKIANIQWPVFNPYKKPTIEIYVSGCTNNCPRCQNRELHDFNTGEKMSPEDIVDRLREREKLFDIISIVGGDLMCQIEHEAFFLTSMLKTCFPRKELWLFTGKNEEELYSWCKEYFDVIKVGKYIEELAQEGFPATSNQRVLQKGIDY